MRTLARIEIGLNMPDQPAIGPEVNATDVAAGLLDPGIRLDWFTMQVIVA